MREYLTKGMPTQAILSVLAGFVHMIARNDLITVETVVGSQANPPSDFRAAKQAENLLEAAKGCIVAEVKGSRYRAKDIRDDAIAIHSAWDSEFGLVQMELPLNTDTVETVGSATTNNAAVSEASIFEEAKTQPKPRPLLTLDIDQFWYPRHMVKKLGKFIVTKGGTNNVVSFQSGYYDRFKFHELPPYGENSNLDMPLYLGFYMGPHTAPYFANHFEGLGDTPNAEFRDKWDVSLRPFLRNEFIQTAEIKDGQQYLVDYGSMRAKKDKKLLPDVEPEKEEEGDVQEGEETVSAEGDETDEYEPAPGAPVALVPVAPVSKKRKVPAEKGQLIFSFDVSLHSLLQKLASRAKKRQRKTILLKITTLSLSPVLTTLPSLLKFLQRPSQPQIPGPRPVRSERLPKLQKRRSGKMHL